MKQSDWFVVKSSTVTDTYFQSAWHFIYWSLQWCCLLCILLSCGTHWIKHFETLIYSRDLPKFHENIKWISMDPMLEIGLNNTDLCDGVWYPCNYKNIQRHTVHTIVSNTISFDILNLQVNITVTSYECNGQLEYLVNSLFRVTTKETSKLCTIGPLWGELTGDW